MACPDPLPRQRAAAVGACAAALLLVVWLRLLPALLAAMGTYAIFEGLHVRLAPRIGALHSRIAAVVLTMLVVALLGWGAVAAVEQLWGPREGLAHLMQAMAEALEQLRTALPDGIAASVPESADELRDASAQWLRTHAREVQHWGQEALRLAAHVLVGLAIGLLVAFGNHAPTASRWAELGRERLHRMQDAFVAIVASQVRISALNTVLTGLFLLVAMPLAGWPMPMGRTLVLVTFLAGLVPILGNLVSNAAIVAVGLTQSPGVGLACLVFLLVVHKLEYFLNAHIVGQRTQVAPAWLLAAMLAGEAAFGIAGVLAAPIAVAWLVNELSDAHVL